MLTSEHPEPHVVLSDTSTQTTNVVYSTVAVSASLTPQEIERMCQAFIRLITAPEKESTNDNRQRKAKNTAPKTGVPGVN
ncbi:MAG: hypothetical protein ACXWPS_04660 [Ktedonobacteraceae bacterium]